jgi:antitoxin component of RelBE/YafQ-DinJ toxin-antitoxin module
MRRLDKQILIRTDERIKSIITNYCKSKGLTLVDFIEYIANKIEKGEL